jgi:hypothetical protein
MSQMSWRAGLTRPMPDDKSTGYRGHAVRQRRINPAYDLYLLYQPGLPGVVY